jgi:hypothetical protein
MAQADQPTPINDLDDLLRYLTEDSGYTKGVAEYMANQRYKDGHLRLTKVEYVGVKPQGEVPINPKFGYIELHRGRMRFVPREPLWRKASYRIAEGCDVRAIWPPHPQQPENKAGPDPFKTGADRPVAAQRRPTKAAKPGSRAAARDAAINSRLANGKRPGSTVKEEACRRLA